MKHYLQFLSDIPGDSGKSPTEPNSSSSEEEEDGDDDSREDNVHGKQ